MCELSRYAWMSHSGCKFAEECERGGGDIGASCGSSPAVLLCLSNKVFHSLTLCQHLELCLLPLVVWSLLLLGFFLFIYFFNLKFTLFKWDRDRCFFLSSFSEPLCSQTRLVSALFHNISSECCFLKLERHYQVNYSFIVLAEMCPA